MAETYKLISQSQSNEINQAGTGFVGVWNVTARVTSGPAKDSILTIQVPESEHNAETVGKLLAAKVSDLTDIASLSK